MANNWRRDTPAVSYVSRHGVPEAKIFSKDNPGAWNETPENSTLYGYGTFVRLLDDTKPLMLYGHGLDNTYLILNKTGGQDVYVRGNSRISDITLDVGNKSFGVAKGEEIMLTNIRLKNPSVLNMQGENSTLTNSHIHVGENISEGGERPNNTWRGVRLFGNPVWNSSQAWGVLGDNSVFVDCKIRWQNLNQVMDRYYAFVDCAFQFQGDAEGIKLNGETAEELMDDFVSRLRKSNSTGKNMTLDATIARVRKNLVFSRTSLNTNDEVLPGSEIDMHARRLGIYLGHKIPMASDIYITENVSPASFNGVQGKVSPAIVLKDNLLTMDGNTNTSLQGVYLKESTIIPLHEELAITDFKVSHNIPKTSGVNISTSQSLSEVSSGQIKLGKNYLVRSSGTSDATVVYSGVIYSSRESSNNYVFRGKEATDFSGSATAKVYEVVDLAGINTVDMRITSRIERCDVQSGQMKKDFWYIVSPKDSEQPEGKVIYDGVEYPVYASFVSTDVSTFSVDGNCQLDEVYSADETVNPYMTFVANDFRAVYLNPFPGSPLLVDDEGVIITSAHPDFDFYVNNTSNGFIRPVKGRIVQYRIGFSTGN